MKNTDVMVRNLEDDFDYRDMSDYLKKNLNSDFLEVFLIKLKNFIRENDSGHIFNNYIEMRMCIKDIFGDEYIYFIDKTLWDENKKGMMYEDYIKSKNKVEKTHINIEEAGTIINLYFTDPSKNKSTPLLAAGIKKRIEDFEYITDIEDKTIKLVFSEGVLYLYGPSKEDQQKVIIQIHTPEDNTLVLKGQDCKWMGEGWDIGDIEVVSKIDIDFRGDCNE